MMTKPLILIIEDDKDIAELYLHLLESSKADIEIIRTGEDAMARLAATVPNIVLLDLKLFPHLSGTDILLHIRAEHRLATTRVIVLTGHPSMVEPVKDYADWILIKPIEIGELQDIVARLLSNEALQTLNATSPTNKES